MYKINKEDIFLMGGSMGGATAVELSKKYPTMFSKMILEAPMCKIDDNMKPSEFTTWIFRNIIAPLFPQKKWAPVKDLPSKSTV